MAENTESGGYDVEFVENEPNDVICSICLFVLREPMQAEQCGHRFCKSCIEKMINRVNSTIACPKDRNIVKVFKDYGKEREILNMLVKCSNNKYGCTFAKELRELEDHLEVCEFQTITCPIQGCPDQVQRKFLDSHRKHKHYQDKYTLLEKKLEQVLQEMRIRSLKMEEQNQKIVDLNFKIATQNQKIQSQNQKNESQNQKITAQANEIIALRQSLSDLESKSTNQLFYHSYNWRINNFGKKFQRAKENMWSEPQTRSFYTNQGYKVKAKVYLNGYSDAWDEWLCVYFELEPGKFDETLKWPMAAEITTTVGKGVEEEKFRIDTRNKIWRDYFYNSNNGRACGFQFILVNQVYQFVDNNTLTLKVDVSHN